MTWTRPAISLLERLMASYDDCMQLIRSRAPWKSAPYVVPLLKPTYTRAGSLDSCPRGGVREIHCAYLDRVS